MKKLLVAALPLLVSGVFAQTTKKITVTNKSAIERTDELVVLNRSLLQKKLGKIANDKYVLVKNGSMPKVVQLDDLDGDGQWDELAFLHHFKAGEKVAFEVWVGDAPATIKAMVRAHIRQRHKLADQSFGPSVTTDTMPYNNAPTDFNKQKLPPYLTEGPAWENDKIGFRKYFDTRNTNDIWGKVTNRMVLEEVGVDPKKIYHHFDADWGMDILKVGKSLGAGALALQVKLPNGKDSLVRFGRNTEQVIYRQIADGPVRAMFALQYKGWKIADGLPLVNATEQISIWGGQFFFENKVTVENAPANSLVVTGIPDFFGADTGIISNPAVKTIYNYGKQSENNDNLGMAVTVPAKSLAYFKRTPDAASEVLNTYGAYIKTGKSPATYRFYAAWQPTDERFKTKEQFLSFLQTDVSKMGSALVIK